MRFKTIITLLLALVALTGQAKDIIWENPSAFMGSYNGEFKITKAELKSNETVLHIIANYQPHSWIRFDKNSYLQTPDGKNIRHYKWSENQRTGVRPYTRLTLLDA